MIIVISLTFSLKDCPSIPKNIEFIVLFTFISGKIFQTKYLNTEF